MNLVLSYESSALAAPQSFRDALQTAANILDAAVTDNITITIQVGYNDWDNGVITGLGTSAVGGDLSGSYVLYSALRTALASDETSTTDQTFVNSLPTTTSVNGQSAFYVPTAVEKALGLISPNGTGIDGAIGIGSSVPTADLVGVALHELTHAMGREPGVGPFDLARYTSAGNHLFSSGGTAPAAYFSIDGGVTKLADYGQNSDPADFLNSGVQGYYDPLNEYYSGGTIQTLTTVDLQQLDVLGFNINYGTGASPSAANSSLVAITSSLTADGVTKTTLTFTLKDTNGNPVVGTAVTLSGSGTNNTFGTVSGTTDANGKFTTTLASTKAQAETITASAGSITETASVTFVAGPASASTSSLVAGTPTLTADGATTTTLTFLLKDANGNPVAGTAVTLSGSGTNNTFGTVSGTTDATGKFTTTLASIKAQAETITASAGGITETASVTFVAGAPSASTSSLVAGTPTLTADGATTTTLTFLLKDANGNPVAGTAVTLSGSGTNNTFGTVSGTTDATGKFTTTLASTKAQAETITASAGGITETASVTFVAGAPSASTSSLVAGTPTLTADGTTTTTLTFTLKDANGNPVAGTAVTLSGSGSGNNFGAVSGTTDASGKFTTTLSSNAVQSETITATAGSITETASVSFVAGAPSASTSSLVAGTPTLIADGTTTTTLTFTLKDAQGHALAGTAVTLSGSGASNNFGVITGTTDANGKFTTTLASTKAQTETITASAGGITETASVSFVAGAPSASTSSLVAGTPTVTANGSSTTTLTFTLKDANGNPVAGTAVTLSGSGTNNTFGTVSGTTDATGKFTTTLASTKAQAETITATAGSIIETASVTFVAGPASASTSSLVAGTPTLTADGTSTTSLTVTIKDANGNAVANTAVTLSGSGTSNSFGTISGTTDATGKFTTTLASTKAQTETITATAGGITETASVTFVAGSASASTSSLVASSPVVAANGNSLTTLTVMLKDAYGNAVAGTSVALSASGSNNTFGALTGTTDATGKFTTTLSSSLTQTETITATAGSLHETASVSFSPAVAVVESLGTTSLVRSGNIYFLDPTAGGIGPTLKYQGATVTTGQFSPLAPIGVEQVGSGYDVAWKASGADQYTVWSIDSNGNYVSTLLSAVSGSSYALESIETTFHQDLNGDGTIGLGSTVIESAGTTSLAQVANNYFLNPTVGGTGPTLKYGGTPVAAGQFAPYATIGVEQTASGYEIAWKDAGTNQFVIWNTDSNGNYLNYAIYAGSSATLEALETSFHQDLNGDGTIGIPASSTSTAIETYGSTALVQSGSNYFFNPVAGGTGPELKYQGSPVASGQFAPFTPIGVEQTASGFELAWKNAGTGQFVIWNTDSSGNFLNYAMYSGTSSTLQSLETSFHQDLNGDGTIGIPNAIESYGSTALVQTGSNYFFNPVAGGTGPELKFQGSPVVSGQFAPYTPVGVEQTASGFQLAWQNSATNQFVIWNTDANGNEVSFAVYAGNSTALESLEPAFHQDLNGDGVVGVRPSATRPADSFVFAPMTENSTNPEPGGPVVPSHVEQLVQHLVGADVPQHDVHLFEAWHLDPGGHLLLA